MPKLTEMLKKLGEDAAFAEAYEADPEGTMAEFGLNDEEQQALRAQDMEQIKALSGVLELSSTNKTIKAY